MTVLTDEGRKTETFESRQARFHTPQSLERFLDGDLCLGELEGLERVHLDSALYSAYQLARDDDLEAAQAILLALALLDHQNPAVLLHLASVTAELGQPIEALSFYGRALSLAPGSIEAWLGRGELLLELGRLEEAVHNLLSAVELDPRDVHPAGSRARLLLQGVLRAATLRLGAPELHPDLSGEDGP